MKCSSARWVPDHYRLHGMSESVSAEHSLTLVSISVRRIKVARESGLDLWAVSEAQLWAQSTQYDRLLEELGVLVSSLVRLVRRDVHRWQKSQS